VDCFTRVRKKIEEVLPLPTQPQSIVASTSTSIDVGDVVKVFDDGFYCEGVVVDKVASKGLVKIDFGDSSSLFKESDCALVVAAVDFEVGDKVEVRPDGTALFFTGHIINVNHMDGTFDVHMDGDDDNDIEYGVAPANMRKIMTSRNLAVERWKRAVHGITAIRGFIHLGHIHHLRELSVNTHDDT